MARVKRGMISSKRRRNTLKKTKGFRNGLNSKEKAAKVALYHGGVNSFQDRKKKKGVMRALHQVKINAASRPLGVSFSKLMDGLKKASIQLDRKVLAVLAEYHPTVFEKVVSARSFA